MTIEGADKALQEIAEYPIKADKVVKEAMRAASRPITRELRSRMPNKSFRKAVKARMADGNLYTFANIGILRPRKNRDAWNHAYWKNYGTLANRDRAHKFTEPRKRISENFKGGIKPRHFFESAEAGLEQIWKSNLTKELLRRAKERKLADGK